MDPVRLIPGRWWIRYDGPTQEWWAMPMWRMWTVENGYLGVRFGPIGGKPFDTLSAAMDYANDPHHFYVDGWVA